MNFEDVGYIINVRKHGNTSVILTVLTKDNGKIKGYVRGALSKKTLSTYQIGNLVHIEGYSRLEENMLSLRVELVNHNVVNFMNDFKKLETLMVFCALCDSCLQEKDPLDRFFFYVASFFDFIMEENWLVHYAFFEFYLLDFLGVGLDLRECAVTGELENLHYVSPKTGRAVTKEVGDEYSNRLYKFPKFIIENNYSPSMEEIDNLFEMTEFFLERNFFRENGLKFPENRASFRKNVVL